MGTWPQSVSGGNGDSLQNVGFAGITFGHEIPITTNGGKVLLYSRFLLPLKLKERTPTTAFWQLSAPCYMKEKR